MTVVHFRSLEKPNEDDFCLALSKTSTYDDVMEKVAAHIGLDDPSKVRLTSHNCYSQKPKSLPIKFRGVHHLADMLVHYSKTSDILYYEVLQIPLPELQGLKTLKVGFHHSTKKEVVIHSIRLPKQSTVGDLIEALKTKVGLSHPNAKLRLLEVFYHKIYKIFPSSEKIENIQYWTLQAEEIPEEEKHLGPHDRLIHVYHFIKDETENTAIQNFGVPFLLVVHEGETLSEVKVRIRKKLQVTDEEISKWKFAFLSLGRPEYLQDSDVVLSRFQRRDVYGACEQYLGMEHSDTTPVKTYASNKTRHTHPRTHEEEDLELLAKIEAKYGHLLPETENEYLKKLAMTGRPGIIGIAKKLHTAPLVSMSIEDFDKWIKNVTLAQHMEMNVSWLLELLSNGRQHIERRAGTVNALSKAEGIVKGLEAQAKDLTVKLEAARGLADTHRKALCEAEDSSLILLSLD